MNKLLLKFLLFLMFASIPMQGFCFPEIPEHHWILNSLDGFWEEPQYTTGNDCLNASSGVSICGISRGYTIKINGLVYASNYKYPICEICRGEDQQCTTDIERYPDVWNDIENYPVEGYWRETEIIFCNFPEDGCLIVRVYWMCTGRNHPLGPIRRMTNAFCYWQTLEMMERSY